VAAVSSNPDDPARVPARGPRPASDSTDTAVLPAADAPDAPGAPDVAPPPPGAAVAPPPPEAPVPPPPEPVEDTPEATPVAAAATSSPPPDALPPDDTTTTDTDPPVDEGVVWAGEASAEGDRDRDRDRDDDGVPDARDPDVTPPADVDTAETPPPAPDADDRDGLDDPGDRDDLGPDRPAGLHSASATADTDDDVPPADRDDPDRDDGVPVTTGVAGAVPALAVEDRYDDLTDDRDPAGAGADERAGEAGDRDGTEADLVAVGAPVGDAGTETGAGTRDDVDVDRSGPPSHDPDIGAPLVRGGEAFTGRWDDIQIDFVDDPRAAVERADGLVGDVVDEIMRALATERERLAGPWRDDESATTEDLRQAFQRYRGVFQRLLRT
jgi:hypothetical protein